MGMSLRLAGFEMRDVIQWLYGSGFPKSHDVSKALDKMAGAEREVIRTETRFNEPSGIVAVEGERILIERKITAPSTSQAKQWEGWGTALKPAYEPALLVRKPLSGTVVQNTLDHGCGGLNVDGCRVGDQGGTKKIDFDLYKTKSSTFEPSINGGNKASINKGRWPSNIILDEQASEQLEQQAGTSRFFYTAKASKSEREAGLSTEEGRANIHPTVKPIDLMRYLIRLITPPHGTVLDPFMGSGSTGCAAALEGVSFIGIEREPEYFAIAQQRVAYWGGDVEGFEYPEPEPDEPDQLSLFW
jgi:site-specific DNA-methyltransferase (adenine-specific)